MGNTGKMWIRYMWNHLQVRLLFLHGVFRVTVKIMFVYLALLIFFCYLVCIKCIYSRCRRTFEKLLKYIMNSSSSSETKGADVKALIVIAHPDDECMFFAPAIIQLVELNASVHLLCLSQGNYYNQGAHRKQELVNSCAVLGIPDSRITIIDHKNLPDDPKAEWKVSLISSIIVKHIKAHSFNVVLTFDERGVSGHANHIAIHKAVRHLASTGQAPLDCCFLSLVTVGLFRKYMSFLELPLSCLLPSCLSCYVGLRGYMQAKEAMFCHRTQLLWFRYLYIAFSRYMFVNTFRIIPHGPKNLKIY